MQYQYFDTEYTKNMDLNSITLLKASPIYKPFKYNWAFEAWEVQQQIHWLPKEVPLNDDIMDWKHNLSEGERNLLTQIFRFFTQVDIEVNNCYMSHYSKIFQPIEIKMMLAAFSNMETVHIVAYAYLLETVGMPETEYSAFMHYKEMKDKYDYMQNFNVNSNHNIALTLAVFGAFTEGLQLFASFAMLLNFQRFSKMKGMCQIVAWSVKDETLHTHSIIKLFHTFISENPQVWTPELQNNLYEACQTIVAHEDAFIDLAFDINKDICGMTAQDIKTYIRYIANIRLQQLNLQPIYKISHNPLPWLDEVLAAPTHVNFFENRVTDYAKAATQGTWEEAFGD